MLLLAILICGMKDGSRPLGTPLAWGGWVKLGGLPLLSIGLEAHAVLSNAGSSSNLSVPGTASQGTISMGQAEKMASYLVPAWWRVLL